MVAASDNVDSAKPMGIDIKKDTYAKFYYFSRYRIYRRIHLEYKDAVAFIAL